MIYSTFSPIVLESRAFHKVFTPRNHHFPGCTARRFSIKESDFHLSNKDDKVEVSIDIPGVKRDALKVTFDNGELEISGTRYLVSIDGSKTAKRKFSRTFLLDNEFLETTKATASLTDGVLSITIPKRERASPVEILVTQGDQPTDGQKTLPEEKATTTTENGKENKQSEEKKEGMTSQPKEKEGDETREEQSGVGDGDNEKPPMTKAAL